MNLKIAHLTLLVNDYDEAINYYTQKLKFELIEDTPMTTTKRWVLVSPAKNSSCNLLLAKATTEEQLTRVGNQTGGRVSFFLNVDNIKDYVAHLKNNNVKFIHEPRNEDYGTVAVISDLYGNLWDVIESNKSN